MQADKFRRLGVDFVYYPSADSMLADSCKYGIIYSQCFRFLRRCSLQHAFFSSVVKLILKLVRKVPPYCLRLCLRSYRRFCKRHLGIYGLYSLALLYSPVETAIRLA